MTKIDIYSGFLGAGKTTLIKKLIEEGYKGERVVLIENEFGDIGIDGGFLQDAGIEITEMNSGCICCSLVGDFSKALLQVITEYKPERVIIEPSGVGKLSDVIRAVKDAAIEGASLNAYTTVVDAGKCKMYMKNFGEFFNDQIENASAILLSHTDTAKPSKIEEAVKLVREHNSTAVIITTPISELTGKELLSAIESRETVENELDRLKAEHHAHHHHHGEHDHDEHCTCGHHHHDEHDHDHDERCTCGHHHHDEHDHDHDEHCTCGHHHHDEHDHDEHCTCGHHHHDEHDHDHDEHCTCGHHHHDEHDHDEHCTCGHHHHHADEVFSSFGTETTKKFSVDEIKNILETFDEDDSYGMVLRAKGIVAADDGKWIHFDYVPGEPDVRCGSAGVIGRLCVIGSNIDEDKIKELFNI